MACKDCKSPEKALALLNSKTDTDWLSQEEVQIICPDCYKNMITNNITRLKKSALLDKLGEKKMEFYELTYTGPDKSKLNLGHVSLDPFCPQYFTEEELPINESDLKRQPNLKITKVTAESKPNAAVAKIAGAKHKGTVGIVWEGPSPSRVIEYGRFERGKPRFDLTNEQIADLSKRVGFKLV